VTSPDLTNQGVANAYVLAGTSKEDRLKRLAELPEENQAKARIHVNTVFAIRNHHRKNKK